MAKAQAGKTYTVLTPDNRVQQVFNHTKLLEWNENDIQVVEVAAGQNPKEGDVHTGAGIFIPYVPPAPTQAEINAAADAAMKKIFLDNLDVILEVLERTAVGADKAEIKIINDAVKAEKGKKN